MESLMEYSRPTKIEQMIAKDSYGKLLTAMPTLGPENAIVEIEETEQKLKLPLSVLKLLMKILQATSEGKPVAVVPVALELSTQSAAELLGCSRPHLVKLLENGVIPFTKVGRHRRVKFEDLQSYKEKQKEAQKAKLIDLMRLDENAGLYDS